MLKKYGFVRVGAIVNEIHLADVGYNVSKIKELITQAYEKGIEIAVFPELSLCGYTIQDMVLTDDLLNNVLKGLSEFKEFSKKYKIIFIVGAPLKVDNSLYNCAFSFCDGHIIGITPKTYIPNYNEYYECRYYSKANNLKTNKINLFGEDVLISNKLIYKCDNFDLAYAIDICEDLWMVNAPSNITSLNGANIIFNLSGSNEIAGKMKYRKNLVMMQAQKTLSAYVYASCGVWESTSDILFSGHSIITEPCGDTTENERFSFKSSIIYQDIDVFRINSDRIKNRSYEQNSGNDECLYTSFSLALKNNELTKEYSKTPFLSHSREGLEEILNIQTYALAKRIKHIGNAKMVVGISGGADSTLAFLVCLRVLKVLNLPMSNLIAITMPGFGTSNRTYNNSKNLIISSGADFREISIKNACIEHYNNIGHAIDKYDVTYENVQARERTQILFDVANMEGGIVVGTGDLSELALGWATYNGDHMSNYAVNCSIPKTLVTNLIAFIRDESEGILKETLTDILNTPISPELLPLDNNGNIKQDTQKSVGPYILHDFFLYHFLRYGASVKKLYFLACKTFSDTYTPIEIKDVLKIFIKRFFSQQFKRNCIPDGIKVGSISLSPRGDLRMSSDTYSNMYLKELEEI